MNIKGLLISDFYTVIRKFKYSYFCLLIFILIPTPWFYTMSLLICSSFVTSLITLDETSGWNKYVLTMPYTKSDYVYSKYLFGIINLIGVSIIAVIYQSIINGLKSALPYGLLSLGIAIIYFAISLPFVFKFGVEKARIFSIAFIAIISASVVFILSSSSIDIMDNISSINGLPTLAPTIVALVGIVLLLISFFISIRVYNNKEM